MADPSTISGLAARYRADSITGVANGGTVSSWPDTSGNGYTATNGGGYGASTIPTFHTNALNSQPAVTFSGSQYLGSNASASASTQTIVAVIVPTSAAISSSSATIRGASAKGGLQFKLKSAKLANTNEYNTELGNSTTSVTAAATVVIATLDPSAGSTWRINGTAAGTSTTTTTLTASTTTVIGANGAGITSSNSYESFGGDIVELLQWSRVLTTAEQATVDSYAQDRYGIAVSDYVPSGANYSGAGAVVVTTNPAVTQSAVYAGSGTVTASATPSGTAVLGYAGSGATTVSATPSSTTTAPYSGAGALTASTSSNGGATVGYTGTGALAASGNGTVTATVAYTGTGTFADTGTPSGVATISYTGNGTVTLNTRIALTATVTYLGGGQLAPQASVPGAAGGAIYTGLGSLNSTTANITLVNYAGAGTLKGYLTSSITQGKKAGLSVTKGTTGFLTVASV